jgi:peptide/nickel transport system permease protein
MAQFLLKRLFQVMLVMFIISAFCFGIQDSLGDPTRELAAMSMSDEERENLRDTLGLNDSLLVQWQLLFFQRTGTHRNIEKIARHT